MGCEFKISAGRTVCDTPEELAKIPADKRFENWALGKDEEGFTAVPRTWWNLAQEGLGTSGLWWRADAPAKAAAQLTPANTAPKIQQASMLPAELFPLIREATPVFQEYLKTATSQHGITQVTDALNAMKSLEASVTAVGEASTQLRPEQIRSLNTLRPAFFEAQEGIRDLLFHVRNNIAHDEGRYIGSSVLDKVRGINTQISLWAMGNSVKLNIQAAATTVSQSTASVWATATQMPAVQAVKDASNSGPWTKPLLIGAGVLIVAGAAYYYFKKD